MYYTLWGQSVNTRGCKKSKKGNWETAIGSVWTWLHTILSGLVFPRHKEFPNGIKEFLHPLECVCVRAVWWACKRWQMPHFLTEDTLFLLFYSFLSFLFSICHTSHITHRSIAFCCISTGMFGYPQEPAAHVAMVSCCHFFLPLQ